MLFAKVHAGRHNRLVIGLAIYSFVLFIIPAQASETVTQITGVPGHTVWQITQPTVNRASTDFYQITFSPAETVTVTATGCVQTGGTGHTWKRYVDPASYGTGSHLYYGQISIPGATSGLVDFDPRQPTVYTIPANTSLPASQMHLQLGYTDDHYSDNGYANRNQDNGNMDQCWGLGDASITIDIAPLPAAAPAPNEVSYTFSIDSIMIRNPRTHHLGIDGTDSDVLGTSVIVNGTQSAVAGEVIGNVRRGSTTVNFPIVITEVKPDDRLSFSETIVNAGNPTSQATTSEVTGIISKIANIVPVAGSVLGAVVNGLGDVINFFNPDCDGPVVADAVLASGNDLALWTQSGSYTRTIGFPGVNSGSGCGSNSYYEVTYTIARTSGGPQPFGITVKGIQLSAQSPLNAKFGSQTRVFRRSGLAPSTKSN